MPRPALGTAVRVWVDDQCLPARGRGLTGWRMIEGVVIEIVPRGRKPRWKPAIRSLCAASRRRYVVQTWAGPMLLGAADLHVVAW
jgi:hypothetical protein